MNDSRIFPVLAGALAWLAGWLGSSWLGLMIDWFIRIHSHPPILLPSVRSSHVMWDISPGPDSEHGKLGTYWSCHNQTQPDPSHAIPSRIATAAFQTNRVPYARLHHIHLKPSIVNHKLQHPSEPGRHTRFRSSIGQDRTWLEESPDFIFRLLNCYPLVQQARDTLAGVP